MKRITKRDIFAFILGLILSGSVVYAATLIARDITYDNTKTNINADNVQDAIDELYVKANNPVIPPNYKELSTVTTAVANDIASGKTAYDNNGTLLTGTGQMSSSITIKNARVESYTNSVASYFIMTLGQFKNMYNYISITKASCIDNCMTLDMPYRIVGNVWDEAIMPTLNTKYSLNDYPSFWVYAQSKNSNLCYCSYDITLSN